MGYSNTKKQKEYQRQWYQRNKEATLQQQREERTRRRDIVQAEKLRRGCDHCGYNASPIPLDAHHYNGDKDFEIGKAIRDRKPLELILAELAKCQILCANCHRIEHGNG